MAEGNCAKRSRYLLIVFNFLFWVCGGGLLGIGLWLRFDNDIYKKLEDTVQLELDLPSDVIFPAAYALIAAGGFIFLTGFCGCCGAIRESFCMLGVSSWVVPESCCKSNIAKCQKEAELRVEFPSQL